MLFLGLLLLVATGVFTGLVIADNPSGGPEYSVSVLDHDIATMNTLAVFCSGLALALVFCLGVVLARSGATHRRHGRPGRHGARRVSPFRRTADPDARA